MSSISRYYDADLDMWVPCALARYWGNWFGPAWSASHARTSEER